MQGRGLTGLAAAICCLSLPIAAQGADDDASRQCGYDDDFNLICGEELRSYESQRPRETPPTLRGTNTSWTQRLEVSLRGGFVFEASARDEGDGVDSPNGPLVAVAVSVPSPRLARGLRLEAEFVHARASDEQCVTDPILGQLCLEGSLRIYAPLFNALWRTPLTERLSPYASVGVGPGIISARASAGGLSASDTSVGVAYQGRAGVEYELSDRVSASLGYRYLGLYEDARLVNHTAEAGVSYRF